MEKQEIKMKSWRIEFIKSKRATPKHVYTYTWSLMGIIVVFNVMIIALGVIRVMNTTNFWGILLLVVGSTLPWPFLYVGLTAKKKMVKLIELGYYPSTEIDIDRYAISADYYNIKERVKDNKLGDGPQFTSDFNKKKVFHEKKSIFSSFRRKK